MRTNPTLSAPSVSTSLAPAPYGLRPLSYQPVRIETPAGKATYVDAQRDFSARASATAQAHRHSRHPAHQWVGWVNDGGNVVPESPFAASSWDWMRKMLPVRSAPLISAPLKSAPMTSAILRSAPRRSAPMRYAPPRLAPLRSAPLRSAPMRSAPLWLSLIHISEPTRRTPISYAVFCLKKKKN